MPTADLDFENITSLTSFVGLTTVVSGCNGVYWLSGRVGEVDWVGHTLGGILATRGCLGGGVCGRRWVSM